MDDGLQVATETVAIRNGHVVLLRGGLTLRVVEGPLAGWESTLHGASMVLGSSPHLESPLTHSSVSRRHALIERATDGSFVVRDLGSLNGTFLDGVNVIAAPLVPDLELRLGAISLQIEQTDRPEVVSLSDRESFGDLVGRSVAMRAVFAQLEVLAKADLPVLILGETGTGKELCARAIHSEGRRSEGSFVVFDCAAAATTLMDAELFGYCRGAFTGAKEDRMGLFERAHEGTLFLDEIGELPMSLQRKLLRAVDRGEFRRVGEGSSRFADVRILAATNRDLERMVADGTFREDLFHRLRGAEVRLPPLRERIEDVPRIATVIARKMLNDPEVTFEGLFGDEVRRAMRRHPWPGNVRELRNWIGRAIVLGGSAAIDPFEGRGELSKPPNIEWERPYHEARAEWVQWFEKRYVKKLLERTRWNISKAAREAQIDRRSLHRLLKRQGMKR